ncbi:MAG: ATP-binding cassette domain-containing protein [Dehalococcoidales bacterium]|nr:MAG: ATP-binding cassette domain-containing protein [Dehalococcoidales bacterium]
MATNTENLVEVENLYMYFPVLAGVMRRKVGDVKAIDGVSFSIRKGETLGLVGESGCGKTTTGRCILQLYKITGGKITFNDRDLTKRKGNTLRHARKDMQLIFQDPYASLDPRMNAGNLIGEPMLVHNLVKKGKEYTEQVSELLRLVQLEPYMADRYPHEFSGGQRQRVGIARALATRPELIICDEPVSALDVSIQTQIITLLIRLREEMNLTYLFIAHDLSVVRHISDRVAVMYLGKIMEITNSDELYDNPLHPYTQALLSAVPIPDPAVDRQRKRVLLTGDVPSPINPPPGCNFHPRCHMAIDVCREQTPEFRDIGNDHWVACHRV